MTSCRWEFCFLCFLRTALASLEILAILAILIIFALRSMWAVMRRFAGSSPSNSSSVPSLRWQFFANLRTISSRFRMMTRKRGEYNQVNQVSERANELSLREGVTWQTMLARATFVIKKKWHTYDQVSWYPGILLETLIWTLFWTFVGNLCSYKTKPLIWPKANNQCSVECIQANMLRNQAFFHNLSFPSFCWNVKTNIPSFQGFFLVLQVINWSFSQTWKTFYTFLHFKANCTRWKQILASNINYWSPTNICQLISQSNLEMREKRARVFPFRWHQMSHSVAEHMRQSCQVCRGFNQ